MFNNTLLRTEGRGEEREGRGRCEEREGRGEENEGRCEAKGGGGGRNAKAHFTIINITSLYYNYCCIK